MCSVKISGKLQREKKRQWSRIGTIRVHFMFSTVEVCECTHNHWIWKQLVAEINAQDKAYVRSVMHEYIHVFFPVYTNTTILIPQMLLTHQCFTNYEQLQPTHLLGTILILAKPSLMMVSNLNPVSHGKSLQFSTEIAVYLRNNMSLALRCYGTLIGSHRSTIDPYQCNDLGWPWKAGCEGSDFSGRSL